MAKVFCLLNHILTSQQLKELKESYNCSKIIYPPDILSEQWAQIQPSKTIKKELLNKVVLWLKEGGAQKSDLFIIQGEFGHTFALVDYALQHNLIPLHAVTKRVEKEKQDGEKVFRTYLFEHICFREYVYFDDIKSHT
ncbi:MAG: hypothetical protein BKP49_09655 [Treponema sp. CETP13]|nr:MAG: hypothetical protein BKP49_09655 [Treponema sp. CETP13]